MSTSKTCECCRNWSQTEIEDQHFWKPLEKKYEMRILPMDLVLCKWDSKMVLGYKSVKIWRIFSCLWMPTYTNNRKPFAMLMDAVDWTHCLSRANVNNRLHSNFLDVIAEILFMIGKFLVSVAKDCQNIITNKSTWINKLISHHYIVLHWVLHLPSPSEHPILFMDVC